MLLDHYWVWGLQALSYDALGLPHHISSFGYCCHAGNLHACALTLPRHGESHCLTERLLANV
jgi:hypothetical protein